ncbi:MAG: Rne/Rng family ribonuclease [Leptolyngbyaceae bacterium]|nr:Rne/Rng family ribonuclease [Leptolyngbyaceae bacterium]
MPKQIIIAEQHRIAAVFSEDQIQELIVATGSHQIGDIYLGIVENVLPGIDAAFVNIGDSERNGFIHVTDLGPLRLRRSAGSITELLAPQQKVLVQVMKEPTGNKGPRLTGNVTLPGRYLVLMPFGQGVNLSSRIRNENERNRLRALAILIKPAGMGLLVRTEAEGMGEKAITEDLDALQAQWESIKQETTSTRAPALLNRDDDFIQRVLRDMYSTDVNRIVVDSHTGLKRVKQHLTTWSGDRAPQSVLIDHHRDRTSILEYFRINAAIREALKPRVDLPSGGYIIIEPTEALTVIDVNSGSFTRSATARETVLWTNSEAAVEIARQLRLRNLAGVIIVDFIDMDARRDQLQVLEQFNKALKTDKARPQIAQLSELGLVELTRKRQGQNIYELFGRSCPTCGGLGHLVHLPGETENAEGEPVQRSVPSAARDLSTADSRSRGDSQGYGRRGKAPGYGERTESPLQMKQRVKPPGYDSRTPISTEAELADESEAEWEAQDDFDLNASGDQSELDLLNHPSYQERGGGNRRRRRRRLGETSKPQTTDGRLDIPSYGKRIDSQGPGRRIDAQSYNRRDALSQDEVLVQETALPAKRIPQIDRSVESEISASSEEAAPTLAKEGWADRSDRSKPTKREGGKPAATQPEIVIVEMTPEEQDVYALMGVSPLVLINREVKDPKSVIVSVALPGQGGMTSSAAVLEKPATTEPVDFNGATPEAVPEDQAEPRSPRELPILVDTSAPPAEPVLEPLSTAIAHLEEGGWHSEPVMVAETTPSDSSRRRRRRSSASDTE